jgi:hypothetical protein
MSFKRFDAEDLVISADSITAPVWSTGAPTLSTFFTSSTQYATNNQYYVEVYQTGSDLDGAAVQFSLAYADKLGSGSLLYNGDVAGKSPTSTTYGQYRTLVFGDEDTDFTLDAATLENFYIVSIDRARYKEKLLPGTFEITTDQGTFIDDSSERTTLTYCDAGRLYKIKAGTISGGVSNSAERGYFLPDIGTIIMEDSTIGTAAVRGDDNNDENVQKFYNDLVRIRLNSEETVSSQYAFVRVRNSEFNYSTNPSNITGSGDLRHDIMINSPQSYVTTVGLYNDNNDLLGVAKLSRPLLKDFTKEALVRIKLDF